MSEQLTYNEYEALEHYQSILLAEASLYEFLKQAWPYIEGLNPFIDGWHIEAICEHLEAVANRQIKNLLINLPPRCSKSTIISKAFPAWRWIHAPHERFLCSSYAMNLATRDSRHCRTLIKSPWYQSRWGNRYQLLKDQDTKARFDNDKKGYRLATSSKSATVGDGGSILISDDPNNVGDGRSSTEREGRLDWWNGIWATRLNDKVNDCRIVVMQRIHEQDIAGYILSHDYLKEWTHLMLPMEFEEKRRSKTIILPGTNEVWEDPREKEGELLWPKKIGNKELASLKQDLGSEYAIAGQLQQRPSPAEGGIIKKAWFQWWKSKTLPEVNFVLQSWDTALTGNDTSSYSACTTWGVFTDNNYRENIILLSMWRDKIEYPQLRERMKRLYYNYNDTGSIKVTSKSRNVDVCLIEAKASGDPLIRDLSTSGIVATAFDPKGYGDKVERVRLITHFIESGLVWVPAQAPAFDSLLPFADIFVDSVACFPNSDSRDLVDTMTQALLRLRNTKFLLHPKDEYFNPSYSKDNQELY